MSEKEKEAKAVHLAMLDHPSAARSTHCTPRRCQHCWGLFDLEMQYRGDDMLLFLVLEWSIIIGSCSATDTLNQPALAI
jgi:hypothetical protein